ncbi:MAG: D-glycero-beta-D-manno-heptose-7-phosphate kinase [bacterium]|nr:D-glycero-beta-D-manno-heptose-7-phosphate kinase [bacterium]
MKTNSLPLTRVRELLSAMTDAQVLVVGDLMLDVYLQGNVERISPEGPVPVVDVRERELRLGGAANVARNIKALGGRPRLLALIGRDESGAELSALLTKREIGDADLVIDETRPTTVKTRVMGDRQQICRYDLESRTPASGEALKGLRESALALLPEVNAVVLSDYGKGVMVDEFVAEIVKGARAQGIPIVVDPKEGHFAAYRGVDLVTPNKVEAGGSFGIPIRSDEDLETVGRGLLDRLQARALMITLGEEGIALFEKGQPRRTFPAEARQVFDVTGAGDTVVSLLALALGAGATLSEGARLANHAAGIVVGRIGTASVAPDEILTACMGDILGADREAAGGLVVELPAAVAWVEKQRALGRKIVFTNGCYDLLHFGHHAILNGAARQGDLLVVGINSDASVKRLKGDSRPVNGLVERAGLLAHLRSVDLVVPFEEDTPLALIRAIKPDVLVKGDEYSDDAIVGAQDVKSWGGRIYRFPMQQGYSTTLMLKKQDQAGEPGCDTSGEES